MGPDRPYCLDLMSGVKGINSGAGYKGALSREGGKSPAIKQVVPLSGHGSQQLSRRAQTRDPPRQRSEGKESVRD
jgi:hypothetical protein